MQIAGRTCCAGSARPRGRAGFSLFELVIVIVILGLVAGIAVPRFSNAAARARDSNLALNTQMLQKAIELYTQEHAGLTPAYSARGQLSASGVGFVARLTRATTDDAEFAASAWLGPYLRAVPVNPFNALATVRVGGVRAGANTHGWRYDPDRNIIEPDHASTSGGGGGGGRVDGAPVSSQLSPVPDGGSDPKGSASFPADTLPD